MQDSFRLRGVRTDDAAHRLPKKQQHCRRIVWAVNLENPYLRRDEVAIDGNSENRSPTFAAKNLRRARSHGPDILAESNQ